MPANQKPIFPLYPVIGIASLVSPTAVSSRAKITGVTGLTELTPVSTNGKKITAISVKASATTVATNLFIWLYDGTNSNLIDEIPVTAVTAGNTTESFSLYKNYELANGASIVLPPTYKLLVSVSVQQNLTVFAHGGDY